jgi:pyruvate formate lyase activating enzyme
MHEIEKYHSYFDRGHGGLTVSGGEPLLQAEFVASLFQAAQSKGIHTTLDTSGFASHHNLEIVLPHTDLVLLDIKSSDPALYNRLTHVDLKTTLESAAYIDRSNKPFWVRFVMVPGLTDEPTNVEGVAQICAGFKNLQRVEILPFHKLGAYKWKELGLKFELEDTEIPTTEQIEKTKSIFSSVLSNQNVTIPIF